MWIGERGENAKFPEFNDIGTYGRVPGARALKMGMNAARNDDRPFALNVMHWLAGALD